MLEVLAFLFCGEFVKLLFLRHVTTEVSSIDFQDNPSSLKEYVQFHFDLEMVFDSLSASNSCV